MQELFEGGEDLLLVRGDKIDTGQKVYFIESGAVGLYSIDGDERNFLFAFKAGDIFGLANKAKFYSGRRLSYRALDNAIVKGILKKDFLQQVKSPKYAADYNEVLLRTALFMMERLDNVVQGQVQQRLIERLIFFAERLGEPRGKRIIIGTPMPHSDIATSINSTRETVNRLMKQLERTGVITVKKQTIVINSLDSLKKMTEIHQESHFHSAEASAGMAALGVGASLTIIQQIIQ